MSVAYEGAEVVVLADVAAWLASSAAFRAAVGAVDATAARALIIEVDGPDPGAVPHAVLDFPVLSTQRTPGGAHAGTAAVAVELILATTPGDTAAEIYRRAGNVIAAIRRELLDAADGRILATASDPPTILDASDSLPSMISWGLSLSIEAQP